MRIRSLLNPQQLHHAVQEHYQHFSIAEQKFLINMLVACDLDHTITERQWRWLQALRHRMSLIAQMEQHPYE
jgi:hypothetical protein